MRMTDGSTAVARGTGSAAAPAIARTPRRVIRGLPESRMQCLLAARLRLAGSKGHASRLAVFASGIGTKLRLL
jgi:hypothetical protein